MSHQRHLILVITPIATIVVSGIVVAIVVVVVVVTALPTNFTPATRHNVHSSLLQF